MYPLPYFSLTVLHYLSLKVTLLQANPQLKQFVRTAIEKSVHELLPPVVERSIKFALPTCEQIIKKVRLSISCRTLNTY